MPKGIYDHSNVVPWNKGLEGFRAGVKHSEETKAKIAASHTGKRHTQATKDKLSKHFKGKPIKEETRLKIQATMRAKFAGIKPNLEMKALQAVRKTTDYLNWKKSILDKFNYTCVFCGETDPNRLTVDHIKPLRLFPELATAPNNGRIVCNICHVRLPTSGRFRHEKTDFT